jgi:hypothetical protein
MSKIIFKKQGYFLVAEDDETFRRVLIQERKGRFLVEFESRADKLSDTTVNTLNEAKEEARKFIRGWENTKEFTGKGYKK